MSALLLSELCTQRERAIYALALAIANLGALYEAVPPRAECTSAEIDAVCELEVELAGAAREFLRLDEAFSAETKRLLAPPARVS
jgi:hypothetical protein